VSLPAPASSDRLSLAEVGAIIAIVLIWGINNAAAKVATEVLPPLLVAGLRFSMAALVLVPFLRPRITAWKSLGLLILLGGPIHFGLIYVGYWLADDLSPFVVAQQMWIPFTALISFLVLGERLPRMAVIGLVVAFVGVAWMSLDPRAMRDGLPIVLGLMAGLAWAGSTVLARRMQGVSPFTMQGLLALVTAPVMLLGSWLFEDGQVAAMQASGPLVWASVVWAGMVSSVSATALLFWLVQRRQAGRVTPYLLATPLVSVAIGVGLMGDVLTPQILAGGAIALAGVGLVALAERGLRAGVNVR
jgi:O-acetylserine/cysteine efflux transporter